MAIIRGFWHFLVGVKDFLVLVFMLILFVGLLSIRSGTAELPAVPDGGVLTIPMAGFLVTQASETSPLALIDGSSPIAEREVGEIVATIEAARQDDRISALLLDLDGFLGGGMANVQAVADALAAFRADGKPVTAYATAYFDDAYLIASHADEIWLNPMGSILIGGPGGSQPYFAEALERLKVDVNVFRVGTYKSAVEPYTRMDASPEAEAALTALVDDLWEVYLADVADARPDADVPAYIAGLPDTVRSAGGDLAQAALDAGLVDRIGTSVTLGTALADLYGEGEDERLGSFSGIDYAVYRNAGGFDAGSGDAVGIVYVAGNIIDGEAPAGTAGGATISGLIEDAIADDDIKALVLRVDSGGGSALASEEIRQALLTAKGEGLPVVASLGPVAASGGYWVATAADTIVAQPATITGSIGVFAVVPTFERTLAEIGIGTDGVQTTPYSGAPDLLGGFNEETRAFLQLGVEDVYRRFLTVVSDARDLPVSRVDEVGQGRVWSGGAARQLGLVDRFGTLDDAIAIAEAAAGFEVGELRRLDVETPPPFAVRLLSQLMGSGAADTPAARGSVDLAVLKARMSAHAAGASALQVADGPAVQARCLSCESVAPRPAPANAIKGDGVFAFLRAFAK